MWPFTNFSFFSIARKEASDDLTTRSRTRKEKTR